MALVKKTLILKNFITGTLIDHQKNKLLRNISVSAVLLDNTGNCPREPGQALPPSPPLTDSCPQPPPCPEAPPCPPTLCPPNPDPGNPCNYCPPPCRDGPDLSRLKKLQCHFQKDDGLPVYLKGGPKDTILYQATLILTISSCIIGLYEITTV